MLEYISGPLARVSPTEAVIEAAGVGYLLNISVNTYSAIRSATEAKLLVHEVIREDAHDLYGFFLPEERTMFRLLIGVSGVGPNTARIILSSFTPVQLRMCITADNANQLKAVKGIGLKTAQRIIVDLKDKIAYAELDAMAQEQGGLPPAASSEVMEEALAALVMLGYQKNQASKALSKVFTDNPAAGLEAAIKSALSLL